MRGGTEDICEFYKCFCLLHYKAVVCKISLNVYYQSYQQHVYYTSVALCAFGTSVRLFCFHLRVLPLSVCLLYVVGLLYHSIFRTNLLSLICTTNMLFERLHQWHQYLFLQLFSINSGVHLISFYLK